MSQHIDMIRKNPSLLAYIHQLAQSGKAPSLVVKRVPAGYKIIDQGKVLYSAMIIKKGLAKCYLTEDTGADFVQEFFGKGELCGEVEMINKHVSFCSIEAITELEVYEIPSAQFKELVSSFPEFNNLLLKSLASKIHYKAIRHSFHQLHSIETNLLRLSTQLPNFMEIIAKQDIANYLGITLRSLNRALNKMKEKKR